MLAETPALDRIDRRIIGILQSDGRISWRELADRVHLAPSSVADRVRRLERRAPVILTVLRIAQGFAIGPTGWYLDTLGAALPPGTDPAEFEATLAKREEVALAMYVTGPADYTIIVDCAGAEGLDAFIRWLKADAGVARTESKFVLRPIL